jgi:hypothetical protein
MGVVEARDDTVPQRIDDASVRPNVTGGIGIVPERDKDPVTNGRCSGGWPRRVACVDTSVPYHRLCRLRCVVFIVGPYSAHWHACHVILRPLSMFSIRKM